MAVLFVFVSPAKASDSYCTTDKRFRGNIEAIKKAWVEVDTYEKLEKDFRKNRGFPDAYMKWQECFYNPWFSSWKSGRTTLSFDEARHEGAEPIETCSSWKTCGPRPDWRSPEDKAKEAAVLKAGKK